MKTNKKVKKALLGMLVLCLCLQSEQFVFANASVPMVQEGKEEEKENNPKVELNQENVQEFLDEYFQSNMKKWKVPGAGVSVVKDGKELYKAGYGVSNIQTQESVNPDLTTFPAASVSKLFTATAIMQLYQTGKLDLNQDIQTYADDISIRNSFKDVITCENLLTHSSGLDEQSELAGSTLNKNAIKSQKQYFNEHIPTVVIQPNTVCQYSNMGYNLLGYVVEKVSGESYEEYVTDNILRPLHMESSSVRIENDSMAGGYEYKAGQYEKVPFAYQYTSGSSGVISTVTDMEHFMLMHLNHGTYENTSVLDSATEDLMQKKHCSNQEVFEGMGEGFIKDSWNGVKVLKHEGALPGFTTTLLLIPEQDFGVYVATNSLGGMVFDFEKAFLMHFYGSAKLPGNVSNPSYHEEKYVGTYRSYDGISTSNISKIFAIMDDTSELKVTKKRNNLEKNQLELTYYEQSKEKVTTNLIYQSDGIFLRGDGNGYVTFREDEKGNVTYAFYHVSHLSYEKIGIFETSGFICWMLFLIMALLLASAILILIKKVLCKKKENQKLWILNSVTSLLYIIGFVGVFLLEVYMIMNYDYAFVTKISFLLTVLLVAVVLNVIEIFFLGYGIIKKLFEKKTAIKLILIQIVQILFVIVMHYFNMIGYHIF